MKATIFFMLLLTFSICKGQNAVFQTSTYDDQKFDEDIKSHKEVLAKLDNNGVFPYIHSKLITSLKNKQKEYFSNKPDYELLYVTSGDIFLNRAEDFAFIVYDKRNIRVSIIVFNARTIRYMELFRDIKVENGLESSECNYKSFGTLDYQVADNITFQENSLMKKPDSFFENTLCKITTLSKDDNFAVDNGCCAKKLNKKEILNTSSLCISTSSVYNNWECLKYDRLRNAFIIFYGQVFAD